MKRKTIEEISEESIKEALKNPTILRYARNLVGITKISDNIEKKKQIEIKNK